jgi:hypothetical protein
MMGTQFQEMDEVAVEQLKPGSTEPIFLPIILQLLVMKFEEMERDSTRLRLIVTMATSPVEMVEVQDELWKQDMGAPGDLLQFQTLVAQCEETVKELVQRAVTMEIILQGMDVIAHEL